MQTDYFEAITYYINTIYINTTLTGTAQTECQYAETSPTDDSGPLPASTIYTYNQYVPFNESFNIASAEFEGALAIKSLAEAYLGNDVNCTIAGHGTGTVKVGVTALTSVWLSYLPQVAAPTSSTPESVKTTSAQAASPPTSPAAPVTTPPSAPGTIPVPSASVPAPPASSLVLSSPAGTAGVLTTQVEVISGPSGLETFSQVYTAGWASSKCGRSYDRNSDRFGAVWG